MKNPFDFNNNGKLDLIDFLVASELDPNNPLNDTMGGNKSVSDNNINNYDDCSDDNNEEYFDTSALEEGGSDNDSDYDFDTDFYNTEADADVFDMEPGDYENWLDSLNK